MISILLRFNLGVPIHNSLSTILINILSRTAFPSEVPSTSLVSAMGYLWVICPTIFLKMCYMES